MINKHKKYCFVGHLGVIFIVMCLLCSCNSEELVPEKTLEAILKEIYLTNTFVNFSEIIEEYPDKDSLDYYHDIYKRYGYTEENVKNTLNHYFLKGDKKLVRIYDNIVADLNKQELLLNSNYSLEISDTEIDKQKYESFFFPSEDPDDMAYFEYRLTYSGSYTLNFKVNVNPADVTVHPGAYIWFKSFNSDTIEELTSINYVKDGNDYSFSIPIEKKDRRMVTLCGYLFYTTGDPSIAGRNAIIKEVKVDYASQQ